MGIFQAAFSHRRHHLAVRISWTLRIRLDPTTCCRAGVGTSFFFFFLLLFLFSVCLRGFSEVDAYRNFMADETSADRRLLAESFV